MAESYFDAFISYAHKDRADWVHTLAENLHQRGFEIFLDAWEIGAGDVLIHELDRGILESRHGVLVLTESYFQRSMVRAEYAAILQRAIEGRQRVIPVLVEDVEVPPLLASRSGSTSAAPTARPTSESSKSWCGRSRGRRRKTPRRALG